MREGSARGMVNHVIMFLSIIDKRTIVIVSELF